MKLSKFFPKQDISTPVNEWFDNLSSRAGSFKVVSTTQVGDGVLIIVETFKNDETNNITDIMVEAINEGFKRNMDNIKLKVDAKEIAEALDRVSKEDHFENLEIDIKI